MLFIVNLLIKTDSTIICVPCMLEHVRYEPFSLKNCRFGRYLMLIGWILCTVWIHVFKTRLKQINEHLRLNVYARMFWEPVYKISYPYLNKQLRKIGRFTYRFCKFLVNLSLLASLILHMICYRAFSFWCGFINTCSFFESSTMKHVLYNFPSEIYW